MEKRIQTRPGLVATSSRAATLPVDYTKMVNEVFETHFDGILKSLKEMGRKVSFTTTGRIWPDEIMLTVTLFQEGLLSATSCHASCDYDPTASSPTAEQLLGSCVDAVAGVFTELLPTDQPDQWVETLEASLSALTHDNVPLEWTATQIDQRKVFVRIDKANPSIEEMTEKWLAENDPERAGDEQVELESDEELMAERVRIRKKPAKSGPTHH